MSTITSKHNKLNRRGGYDTGADSTQLIYPKDLPSMDGNSGLAVIFEPNIILGNKVKQNREMTKPKNAIPSQFGGEVAMQTQAMGGGSLRSSDSGAFNQNGKLYAKSDERIVLPMPASLTTTYASNWQASELGVIGRGLDFAKGVADLDGEAVAGMAGDSVMRTLGGAVQGLGIANVKDYIELKTGAVQNPYNEVLYRGNNNRMVPFNWTLIPRNAEEAEIIRSIIQRFKYHKAPEYKYTTDGSGSTAYLLAPSTFDITFYDFKRGARNPWLWKMSTCALTNMTVNGSPNGEVSVMKDGALQAITLDLMFTELTLWTKQQMADPEDTM